MRGRGTEEDVDKSGLTFEFSAISEMDKDAILKTEFDFYRSNGLMRSRIERRL